jgi:magnesium-transporting ATPase (P-type)
MKGILAKGISLNSTAILIGDESSLVVSGSKTEGALLLMLRKELGTDYIPIRASFDSSRGDQLFTFSSLRKRMSVFVRSGKGGIIYTKGASEVILEKCTKYVNNKGNEVALDKKTRIELSSTIEAMAKRSLRTIVLAHRTFEKIKGSEKADELENELVLDALFGIKDPLRPDVIDAVKACQKAGIIVRMVTGDNIETAKAIASECGILTEGGIAMEGPDFRKLTPKELDKILPYLQVLARSSPNDKHILVTRLNGHALPKNKEEWLEKNPDGKWEKHKDLILPGY